MKKKFSGPKFVFRRLWWQHPSLHKTKGPARKPISGTPPPLLRRAPMPSPPPQSNFRAASLSLCVCVCVCVGGCGCARVSGCSRRRAVPALLLLPWRRCSRKAGTVQCTCPPPPHVRPSGQQQPCHREPGDPRTTPTHAIDSMALQNAPINARRPYPAACDIEGLRPGGPERSRGAVQSPALYFSGKWSTPSHGPAALLCRCSRCCRSAAHALSRLLKDVVVPSNFAACVLSPAMSALYADS